MEFMKQWIQNLANYMILSTVILHLVPNETYQKYVKFFVGLILMLILLEPILNLFEIKNEFQNYYLEMKQMQEEIEKEWNVE